MALIRCILLAALLALGVSSALALGGNSWLVSGPPRILGVTLSNSYFSGTQSPGTTIGQLTVNTTGIPFSGSLALSGPDAAKFTISGGNLNNTATLTPGTPYNIIVTPTGYYGVNFQIYGGVTYFMSPTGNDANNGTSSGTPWKSVAHNIHCADTISAAAGTYLPISFGLTFWGTVSCPSNDNVAWVKCASTLGTCNVNGDYGNQGAMAISSNYWGVQGFEATDTASPYGGCFGIFPPDPPQPTFVHHVVYANNIANTCPLGGFVSNSRNGGGTDYMMIVGNMSYNAAISSTFCGSGISLAVPQNIDSAPEPHIYIALNMVTKSIDGPACNGGIVTDGQGIIIDRPDILNYTGIITIENNLLTGNGGPGFHQGVTSVGNLFPNMVMFRFNTDFGNIADPNFCPFTASDTVINNFGRATITNNLIVVNHYPQCGQYNTAPLGTQSTSPGTLIDNNWLYNQGAPAQVATNYNGAVIGCLDGTLLATSGTGISINNWCPANTIADPVFASPSIPGQWFCSGYTDTIACAIGIGVVANWTPTATGAAAYGWRATTPTDKWNTTRFFKNVLHALPANLNPHGF